MPGANCSIVGCGTSRYTKGGGIFRLPYAKPGYTKTRKMETDFLGAITSSRTLDSLELQEPYTHW